MRGWKIQHERVEVSRDLTTSLAHAVTVVLYDESTQGFTEYRTVEVFFLEIVRLSHSSPGFCWKYPVKCSVLYIFNRTRCFSWK